MTKNNKNKIVRYADKNIHHFLVRYQHYNIVHDFAHMSKDKNYNFAYLVNWNASDEILEILRNKIEKLSKLCKRIFVNLGEPGFMWNYTWEDKSRLDTKIYSTIDYINSFTQSNVCFFLNLVPLRKTLHKTYYVNDMFFYGNQLYLNNTLCADLLSKCNNDKITKKYKWEAMCSFHEEFYYMIKRHKINDKTLSTCRSLGISFYGEGTVAPTFMGGETFSETLENRNIRTSDLIDPSIYNESWYSLVFETTRCGDFAMFSEKEAKPIMAKRLFAIFGSANHLRAFKKLGFESFGEVFDESYDQERNDAKRFAKLLDSMHMLSKEDPVLIYKKIKPILEHNYHHFMSRHWNDEFIMSWENPLTFC